jgi:Zn-dependent protease
LRETSQGVYFGNLFGFPLFAHRSLLALAPTLGFLVVVAGSSGDLVDRILVLVFLLGSVLVHELAHAFAARASGVPVRHIALTWFGGYAEFYVRPARHWQEVIIALAGPLANLAIGAGTLLLASTSFQDTTQSWREGSDIVIAVRDANVIERAVWMLGWLNVSLGLFNQLPGLPLDGGHVLRSVLSGVISSRLAHAIAAFAGLLIGLAVVAYAVRVETLWTLLIGVFLMASAWNERGRV